MSEPMGASRARVLDALNHRQPDAVPVDFGSTAVTGMHVTCVAALRKHFGLEERLVKVCEPYQMLGEIEADLAAALGIDTVPIPAVSTIFGFANEDWKPWRAPWGQDMLVSKHFNTTRAANGDVFIYPCGDMDAPPSAHMPASGFFFDTIIRQDPVDDAMLDPEDNLEEFQPLAEETIAHYRRHAEALRASGKAVVSGVGGTAVGDIALVPAPFLRRPKGIRDVAEWYMSTLTRQDYLHKIFTRQTEIALDNLARVHAAVGDGIDALFVCGTDFGTQRGTFCSVETFNELYAPYYRAMNQWIHANTPWKSFKHSCGSVVDFIEPFIESGFDIVNPVQCSAAGMDPATLKARFGDRIVFWGGGVDTQQTLPFGTPEQVREEVVQRCEIFAPGGGFIFNAVHNIQANTPVRNIVAMFDAVREFNGK